MILSITTTSSVLCSSFHSNFPGRVRGFSWFGGLIVVARLILVCFLFEFLGFVIIFCFWWFGQVQFILILVCWVTTIVLDCLQLPEDVVNLFDCVLFRGQDDYGMADPFYRTLGSFDDNRLVVCLR